MASFGTTFPHSAPPSQSTWLRGVLVGIALTAVATVAGFAFSRWLSLPDILLLQLVAVLVVAVRFPAPSTIAVAVLSFVSFDYFFIPPRCAFAFIDAKHGILFGAILFTSAGIAHVNERLRRERQRALARERAMAKLNDLLRDLALARSIPDGVAIASRDLCGLLGAPVKILVARGNHLAVDDLPSADRAEAETCWRTLAPTHRGAPSKPAMQWRPLVGSHRPIGILGIHSAPRPTASGPDEATIERCAAVIADALERIELAQAAGAIELRSEVEQFRSSLLGAASHDLRTPLASILAAGDVLAQTGATVSDDQRRRLAATVVQQAERLKRLVENLLELARLRTRRVEPAREIVGVDELLASALRARSKLESPCLIHVEGPCPKVRVQRSLIEQVIVNLMEAEASDAPDESTIDVWVEFDGAWVSIDFVQRSPAIGGRDEHRLVDWFHRGADAVRKRDGLNVGLTNARMIVESHGGQLELADREDRAKGVRIRLPHAPDA
jgi:two-component system sensor histidine kinase KdpD